MSDNPYRAPEVSEDQPHKPGFLRRLAGMEVPLSIAMIVIPVGAFGLIVALGAAFWTYIRYVIEPASRL